MSDLEEMNNQGQPAQPVRDRSAQHGEQQYGEQPYGEQPYGEQYGEQPAQPGRSAKDMAMDQASRRLDADGDDQFADDDDQKMMGEDAVNKVKGLFKKD
jgi:hypothetical protein